MAKRIMDLTNQGTNAADYYVEIDKTGDVETKRMSMMVVHGQIENDIDATGLSSQLVTFGSYNCLQVTIDQDCSLNIQNIPTTDVTLVVIKGSTDIATLTGVVDAVSESRQDGETVLFYRIYEKGSNAYAIRINNQYSDTLVIGDLTPNLGTINSLDHFKWKIEGTMCNINCELTYTPDPLLLNGHKLTITLSNFDPTLLYGINSLASFVEVGADNYSSQCTINDSDEIDITWDHQAEVAQLLTIYINGSFEIV